MSIAAAAAASGSNLSLIFFSCGFLYILFRCQHVIAIDIDAKRIDYAQHNAAVYGVKDLIDFVIGNCLLVAPALKVFKIYYQYHNNNLLLKLFMLFMFILFDLTVSMCFKESLS